MKNRDASDESSRGGLAPEHVAPAYPLTSCGDVSLFYSPGGQKDVKKAFSCPDSVITSRRMTISEIIQKSEKGINA